jgi:hypothetical protein
VGPKYLAGKAVLKKNLPGYAKTTTYSCTVYSKNRNETLTGIHFYTLECSCLNATAMDPNPERVMSPYDVVDCSGLQRAMEGAERH